MYQMIVNGRVAREVATQDEMVAAILERMQIDARFDFEVRFNVAPVAVAA